MKVTPLSSKVIIEVEPREEVSKGGIILPDVSTHRLKDNFVTGKILSVGPGKRHRPTGQRIDPQVQVGQRCIFNDNPILRVVQESPRQVICEEENILVVLA